MNTLSLTALVILCGAVFGALGYLIARSRAARRRGNLEAALKAAEERAQQAGRQLDELRTVGEQRRAEIADYQRQAAALHAENRMLREQAATAEAVREELERSREENNRLQADRFRALAAEMLEKSQQKLVTVADDRLTATSLAIRERLQELDQSLRQFEKGRIAADTELNKQITDLAHDAAEGRRQTRSLVEALRKPQVRGAWGEMHLKRSVELAGMQEHCDFHTQVSVDGDDGGRLRPDMVVHLTGGKHVVVDAKVSLSAFLAATEATDEAERERHWAEHAKQLRKHVDTLAGKEYFSKVAGSPDFVVMYLPGEALLQPALEHDPRLLEYAADKRVFIAGPTNLTMILRTVAFAWSQAALEDNLRQVYELGRELYDRLGTLGGHLSTLGSNLDRSVNAYNKAISSLERRVLVTARRFQSLKVVQKELAAPKPVDQATNPLGSPELVVSAEAERTPRALPASAADGTMEIA